MRKIAAILTVAGLVALLLGAIACGDDDDNGGGGGSEEEKQELADLVLDVASVNGETGTQEEIDFYLAHITDSFVQTFGVESMEACGEDPANCIGEPPANQAVDLDTVEIDVDSATLVLTSDDGPFGVELSKEGDIWKASGLFVPDDELPEGAEVVNVEMNEFAFGANLESDVVKSGDFAMHAKNVGEQAHELILVPLPEDGALEDILMDESFEPEPIVFKLPYGPGDESDIALPEPLTPGRYAFVCFFPDTDDPEMTPHAFKGMTREFTVE